MRVPDVRSAHTHKTQAPMNPSTCVTVDDLVHHPTIHQPQPTCTHHYHHHTTLKLQAGSTSQAQTGASAETQQTSTPRPTGFYTLVTCSSSGHLYKWNGVRRVSLSWEVNAGVPVYALAATGRDVATSRLIAGDKEVRCTVYCCVSCRCLPGGVHVAQRGASGGGVA